MFLTLLLFQSSQSEIFLQLSQANSASPTSRSSLSEGLETYSDELSSFSENLSSGLNSLDQSINLKLDQSYSVASSILNTRINELLNEKSALDYEIAALNKKLKLLTSSCETFSRCVDCLTDPGCVWCPEGSCVAGNEEGPYQNNCKVFQYSFCLKQSCEDFLTCNSCTAENCGWCESTLKCFKGTASNSGSCDDEFYYHQDAKKCSAEADRSGDLTEVNVFKAKNPTNSIDPAVEEIENRLQQDYSRYAEIEEEVDVSLYQKENIFQTMRETQNIQVEKIQVGQIEGYSQQVKQMEEQELEKSHQFQQQNLKDAGQRVIDFSDQVMEEMTDEVIEAIQNLTAYYEEMLEGIGEKYNLSPSPSSNSTETNATAV